MNLLALTCAAPAQPQKQNQSASNALAKEIIAAWQNSSRSPTPQDRIAQIEKALKLAVPANPWPFRDPPRDALLGQMWGQLGNEYRRIEGAERPEALERALQAYGEALRHVPRERAGDWARVQFGLGSVYLDRISGGRPDNIERAIAAFNSTAEVMTKAQAPSMWGSIQTMLAKAHWHRIRGARADNLENAIAAAEGALSVFSREKEPGDWSGAQQALGAAYWGRIKGSRADNIERAIAAYEQALSVLSEQRNGKAWAGVHDNIGMAYAERVRGTRSDNLQKAAASFEAAARVFTRERYPFDWAQLNMNFGNLLLDDEAGPAATRLERAISSFEAALTVYTAERFPERWARVLLNLGIAFKDRIAGNRGENTEKAIQALQDALRFYTPDNDPLKWSIAQSNLAAVLRHRQGVDRAATLAAAAAATEAALTVQTLSGFPHLHLRTTQHAGVIEAIRGNWAAASRHFARAIEASDLLIGQGLDPVTTRHVLSEGISLYSSAAFAALQQDNVKSAVELLDKGKARVLRVALGLDALALSPDERSSLDERRRGIAELDKTIESLGGEERRAALEQMEKARAAIQEIIQRAARSNGDPAREAAATNLQSLLQHYAAVVMPLISDHGAALLLATRGERNVPALKAVPLPGFDRAALARLLKNPDPASGTPGWIDAYAIHQLPANQQTARLPEWMATVTKIGEALKPQLGQALGAALTANGVAEGAHVLWVPHTGLGLLPIGLTALRQDGRALIDAHVVTIAPSLAAAEVARQRAGRKVESAALAAVINPTGDLAFAEPEGAVAASYFKAAAHMLGAANASADAVTKALGRANYWHFATHGKFYPRQPRQSTLALASQSTLTLGDLVDSTDLGSPRLVILSACETGLVELGATPEEFSGLPSAFLQAGAAGVVASLWPVDDTATALLMIRFYDHHLGRDLAPARALREAQLWLRDASPEDLLGFLDEMSRAGRLTAGHHAMLSNAIKQVAPASKPYRHPHYWAAFQHYGG